MKVYEMLQFWLKVNFLFRILNKIMLYDEGPKELGFRQYLFCF